MKRTAPSSSLESGKPLGQSRICQDSRGAKKSYLDGPVIPGVPTHSAQPITSLAKPGRKVSMNQVLKLQDVVAEYTCQVGAVCRINRTSLPIVNFAQPFSQPGTHGRRQKTARKRLHQESIQRHEARLCRPIEPHLERLCREALL